MLFERALNKLGFAGRYFRMPSFEAAQRWLAQPGEKIHPTLIVADSQLGFYTAREVVQWAKSDRALASVPVVVYGGIMTESRAHELREAGAILCLQKPVTTAESMALIREMLKLS